MRLSFSMITGFLALQTACTQSTRVCAPGSSWAGDICVAQDCADFAGFTCQLADGGIGICTAGACLDLASDPENCGSYGFACPPSVICREGYCWIPDGGYVGCEQPRTLTPQVSSPSCVLETCAAGTDNQQCLAPPGTGLLAGFCCHGVCTTGDEENCGGCGIACGQDAVCADPLRGCLPATDCASADPGAACRMAGGLAGICCQQSCVAESFDPGYCNEDSECSGTSGNEVCLDFSGSPGRCCGDACVQSEDNQLLCGTGSVCKLCFYGQLCSGNACLWRSPSTGGCSADGGDDSPCLTDAGYTGTCCGSACVDLDNDLLNCRYCGVACSVGDTCTGGCNSINGCSGGAVCPAGYACAGSDCLLPTCNGTNATCVVDGGVGLCCGDRCVQPSANGPGCGACGSSCPTGSECLDGYYCYGGGSDGAPLCGPAGKTAAGVGPCPAQTICSGTVCSPILDCSSASRSPGSTTCIFGPDTSGTCCGDGCVEIWEDPANCGACGVACASGICDQGHCLADGPTDDCDPRCGPGTVCLNGGCIGSACGFNAGVDCLAEDGTIGVCCGTGVCAHLRDDPQRCGACGNVCPAGQSCTDGACSGFSGCAAAGMNGFCNLDGGTTYACCPGAGCTNLLTDPANCGYCGFTCSTGQTCVDGTCV